MAEAPSPLQALISELKRRKVFRVALVYLAIGWLVIEVADTVFPRLALPDWAVTLVVALTVLGFPLALVLAWAFDVTPGGVRWTGPGLGGPGERREEWLGDEGATAGGTAAGARAVRGAGGRLTAGRIAVVGAVAVLALAGGAFIVFGDRGSSSDEELDASRVAVLPFRVSGDPSLEYLGTGMVDLLSATLTGEGGPRALDPAQVLGRAERMFGSRAAGLPQDSAASVARSLGAGHVLTGSVVGTPGALTLTARLAGVGQAGRDTEARVVGPADSLVHLVDRLAAQLLSLEAGESEQRVGSLARHPLPALRAYLAGQAAFRSSHFDVAVGHYDRALRIDSTFALAALQYQRALAWNLTPTRAGESARAARLAWTHREHLSPADRAFLRAMVGPNYPDPSSYAERIREWERVVNEFPERPDAWFQLGDLLSHYGYAIGREDAWPSAIAAFQRTLALDSSYAPALLHLVDFQRDSAEVARLTAIWTSRDSSEYVRDYARFARATTGDSAALSELRERLPRAHRDFQLYALWSYTSPQHRGITRADGEGALALLLERAGSRAERAQALRLAWANALNEGRPRRALELGEQYRAAEPWRGATSVQRIWDALLWPGDTAAAEAGARELAPIVSGVTPSDTSSRSREALCAVSLWRLSRGVREPGEAAAAVLGGHPEPATAEALESSTCALMLRAWLAVEERPGALPPPLERLDSLLAQAPPIGVPERTRANLLAARLLEQAGETERALAAVRRRSWIPGLEYHLSTTYREEGRLAAVLGDTAAAIEAYSNFLRMHEDPEPSVLPEVERIRQALRALGSEG